MSSPPLRGLTVLNELGRKRLPHLVGLKRCPPPAAWWAAVSGARWRLPFGVPAAGSRAKIPSPCFWDECAVPEREWLQAHNKKGFAPAPEGAPSVPPRPTWRPPSWGLSLVRSRVVCPRSGGLQAGVPRRLPCVPLPRPFGGCRRRACPPPRWGGVRRRAAPSVFPLWGGCPSRWCRCRRRLPPVP